LDFDYSDALGPPSSPESRSFVSACPLQWLPVLMAVVGMPPPSPAVVGMPPPSPPLHPGSQYAYSSSDLIAALNDRAVSRIVLKAGTYEFDDDMCSNEGGSALCIDRNVTIEAEVAGTVVLNATGARRVIYVAAAGRAELVGLNITGGQANSVSSLASIQPSPIAPMKCSAVCLLFSSQGAGLHISGTATLINSNVYENEASGSVCSLFEPSVTFHPSPLWTVTSLLRLAGRRRLSLFQRSG